MIALVIVSWPSYARVVRGLVRSLIGQSDYVLGDASARLVGAQRPGARRAAERARAGRWCWPRSTSATRSCCSPASRSSASARSRRRRSGAPAWPRARSTSRTGGSARFPGFAIFTVVLAFNFLGDSLRDALDPHVVAAARGTTTGMSALLEVERPQRAPADGDAARSRSSTTSSYARRAGSRSSASPARAAAARRSRCSRSCGCCRTEPQVGGQRDRSAAATCWRCAGARCAACAAARSRWSSRIPLTSLHPMLTHRPAADRARALPRGPRAQGGRCARARAARAGAHPRSGGGAARVPAPVLRRHAAAHRDRRSPSPAGRSC